VTTPSKICHGFDGAGHFFDKSAKLPYHCALAEDEVILPDVTWIASAAPISYVGAKPVFADIETQTWCFDPKSVEERITPRTKAIIAVDLYGGMPDFDRLKRVAEKYELRIIEDAAEVIGSIYKGQKAGACGRVGTFSFHGSKTLTTGEGGALVTDDTSLYERVLFLRDHGRQPGDVSFQNTEIAYKYKMSSLQAAFGYGQLSRIDELVSKKRQIWNWYRTRLGDHPALTLNPEPANTLNSYWMTTLIYHLL
jgi:perosamine synthetase